MHLKSKVLAQSPHICTWKQGVFSHHLPAKWHCALYPKVPKVHITLFLQLLSASLLVDTAVAAPVAPAAWHGEFAADCWLCGVIVGTRPAACKP